MNFILSNSFTALWQQCQEAFSDEKLQELSEWRGYSLPFCGWLREQGLVGIQNGLWAIPVHDEAGIIIATHFHLPDGRWFYRPNTPTRPLILGSMATAQVVWTFESQWDGFAAMEKMGWHENVPANTAIVITRGAGNGKLVKGQSRPEACVYAFVQNDPVKRGETITPAEKWLAEVTANAGCPVYRVSTPAAHKDVNDWTRAGSTGKDIAAAIRDAVLVTPTPSLAPIVVGETPIIDTKQITILPSGDVTITDCSEELFSRIAETETLFSRYGTVTELVRRKDTCLLERVTAHAFRSRMEEHGGVFAWRVGENGGQVLKPVITSVDTAQALLESRAAKQMLPPIKVVVNAPILLADGGQARVVESGYDRPSGILVTGGKVQFPQALAEAVAGLNELVSEFDFATPGDRSRALASYITPAMKFGAHLSGHIPINVIEADQSQSGKTYLERCASALYNEVPSMVSQRTGGVGSADETLDLALIAGRPFLLNDNQRGKYESSHLESLLTAHEPFPCRVPYQAPVLVDPDTYIIGLTSNGVETSPDLANRSSIVRIRKRVGHKFKRYPEGDLLDHIRANQGFYLGCVFAVVVEWLKAGKPRTEELRHSFREWAQSLDWMIQYVMGEAPLLDDHEHAQLRVSNSSLGFLRRLALAAADDGMLGTPMAATELYDLAEDNGIEVPGLSQPNREAGSKVIGGQMSRLFKSGGDNQIHVDGFEIHRSQQSVGRDDGRGSYTKNVYSFTRLNTAVETPKTGSPASPARIV